MANTATAPTQVVSRKLRIGILPATVPRATDAKAPSVPRVGTHSMGRLPAACHSATRHNLALMPAWLTNIRQDSRYTDVLEAGSRKKPIPAIYRLQPSFLAFVEPTGIDAAKHFDKAQNIERLLRE